jgi:hypothetical protein
MNQLWIDMSFYHRRPAIYKMFCVCILLSVILSSGGSTSSTKSRNTVDRRCRLQHLMKQTHGLCRHHSTRTELYRHFLDPRPTGHASSRWWLLRHIRTQVIVAGCNSYPSNSEHTKCTPCIVLYWTPCSSEKFMYQVVPFHVNIYQLTTGRCLSLSFYTENKPFTGLDRALGLREFEAPRIYT